MIEIGSTKNFMYVECLICNLKQPDRQPNSKVGFAEEQTVEIADVITVRTGDYAAQAISAKGNGIANILAHLAEGTLHGEARVAMVRCRAGLSHEGRNRLRVGVIHWE